ncbi:beta-N-acetylhexosaminidase [Paraglaciecola sp. L1A13]|uniref:beta-N-acetylhexosaminidase n=1 Tax=Paraglaciecola sp. L1A13 TaxID=2686359 RepID=UPI00131DB399|nr:beta-N-acetylhexosaminidase [Paraglaciecola sp. L1A13]
MLDVAGCELTPDDRELLDHPLVGGVILFSRNYYDQKQLAELIGQIRLSARNNILIGVDHEGGRVQRFRHGFSAIPAMGEIFNRSHEVMAKAEQYCDTFGWLMAAECLAFDIDLSFAPVLDLNGVSDVIGDRSFHRKPEPLINLASHFIKGMHRAGMKATGKHFPGHGNVKEDSHIAMPVDGRSLAQITELDMRVFTELHAKGLLDGIMPAHVVYPEVDDMPAGFSKIWLQTYLREKMNFDGVIFSDDLSMQGAAFIGDFAARAKAAMHAGCDMVLVCNNPDAAAQVIDSLPSDTASNPRLARLAKVPCGDFTALKNSQEYSSAQRKLAEYYD